MGRHNKPWRRLGGWGDPREGFVLTECRKWHATCGNASDWLLPVVEVRFRHDRVLLSSLAPSKLPFRPIGGLEVDQRPVSFCLLRRSLMPVAGVVQP